MRGGFSRHPYPGLRPPLPQGRGIGLRPLLPAVAKKKNSDILLLMPVDLFLSFLSKLAKVELYTIIFILKQPGIGFG